MNANSISEEAARNSKTKGMTGEDGSANMTDIVRLLLEDRRKREEEPAEEHRCREEEQAAEHHQ